MFIKTNDRIVNLKNVSNINILTKQKRIVFNLNYPIDIFTRNEKKQISDYVYWDAIDDDEMLKHIEYVKYSEYVENNFIEGNSTKYGEILININEISSIKFSDKKLRVIFNLSHPVTINKSDIESQISSEFVYVTLHTDEEYKIYSNYVRRTLNI